MNILSKIILLLLSISILVFLIYFTFITNSISNFEEPYYENLKSGLFELNKNENEVLSLSKLSENSEITVSKIGISDKIIFSSGSVSTTTSSGNTIITLTNGIYFFDLKEINTNYIISGTGFEINNKGPGNFIINSQNENQNLIFSINSVLDLNLKEYKKNTEITSLDLYPHTYLLFNPKKNIFVKNSDLLKISQTFNIGYFKDKILDENNLINKDFINIATIKQEKDIKIINNSLLLIQQELNENKNILNNFVKSNFGLLPGETFINKYFVTLKNPNKKSIYYKNLILRNLHDLITSDKLNLEIINEISTNSILLKKIDPNGFNEIKSILNYYYGVVIKSNLNINSKINITKLINKINNNYFINESSFVYLEKIFFEYDFIDEINFYKEFSSFRINFFEDLKIDISKKDNANLYNIKKVDYFLFFIENILMSDFSSSNNSTKDLIDIFSDYVNIANNFYSNSDYKIKRTGIFTYSKILNNFVKTINNKYFLEERNENLLLELNPDETMKSEDFLILKDNILNIIGFYNDNKDILKPETNNKDKFVIKLYSSLEEKFTELFSAIKNYSEYVIEYDKNKKELLNTSSINETNDNIVLSYSHAIDYLNNFNGLQLKYINISIMDYNYCKFPSLENSQLPVDIPYCYKIDNLYIDSNNISFLLFPFEKNKIEEIVVQGINKVGSYKLDEIKIALDEKKKTETKDKEKYEFKNFLSFTFGQQIINNGNSSNNSDNINETIILQEDSIVKIFKRNKLLGDLGDFANLKGFLEINYNDLIVINSGDDYSINVKLGIFNIDLGRNSKYKGEFSSMYDFPNHSFINPKLKIIDIKSGKDLLLGNYIYITGGYKVNLINEEIKNMFFHYNEISFIVNNIKNYLNNSETKIVYIKETDKILFETTFNGSKVNFTLENGSITNFVYSGENKLEKNIPYTEINKIFNNIK